MKKLCNARWLLLPITTISMFPAAAAAQNLKGTKPNIILIITDDQGYGDHSCHGYPILKTPNIDAASFSMAGRSWECHERD